MQHDPRLKGGIASTASALGISPVDLATAISYETAGTFDPTKRGPTTQWGQHRGLIQFGEPQAKKYGVDWANPIQSQLGPDGAVAKYLLGAGVKPGMGMLDIYSAINAGSVGKYNASDAGNGGAPGSVADKVNNQMAGHRKNALAMFGGAGSDQLAGGAGEDSMNPNINFVSTNAAASREELDRRKTMAQVLQARAAQPEKITHATQGLAKLVNAWAGVQAGKQNSEAEKEHNAALSQALMGNGTGAPLSNERLAQVMALNPELGQKVYAQQQQAEQARQLQAQKAAADQARIADERAYSEQQWAQRNEAENSEWTRRQDYERENAPKPDVTRIVAGNEAVALGLPAEGSFNVTTGPSGTSAKRVGGGGTNVTVNTDTGEGEFAKVTGRELAQSVNEAATNGDAARQNLARIDRLEGLLAESPQGWRGGIVRAAGALGVHIGDNADDLQAARSLISAMVPDQRPAGSGTMSDADLALFKDSLPNLINSPDGNAKIIQTIRGIAQYDMERGQLARDLQLGDITREQYFSGLQNLSNPLAWLDENKPDDPLGLR